MAKRTCTFQGCGNPHVARGYCLGHYQQLRAGKELTPLKPRTYWHGAKCPVVEDGQPCGRDIVARGYCGKHFQRWNKNKDADPAIKPTQPKLPPAICSECDQPVHGHGYCTSHHARWYKYGDPHYVPPPRGRATCIAVEDGEICGLPVTGSGYCGKHYTRFRKHGDPSVVLPPSGGGIRKYSLDEGYFSEITTPEQAYWLGFLAADGGIIDAGGRPRGVRLELAAYDVGHLLKFAYALGSDAPISGPRQNCLRITFNSSQLAEDLAVYGVTIRKSLVVVPPLEKLAGLERYYWRGLWDGDGHVCVRKNRRVGWAIGIAGSLACVDGFAVWARKICGSKAQPNNKGSKNPDCWQWGFAGTRKAQLLAEQLRLAGPRFGLDRKQVLLEEICAFDLDAYEARLDAERAAQMRDAWATGRHPRAKRG
jgi:hypothetical protein